jgi:predicted nucleotidyltransferase
LEHLLGVAVDVLTPKSLPEAFRQTVLDQAQSV